MSENEIKPIAWMLECQNMGNGTGWKLSWTRSGAGVCLRLNGEAHEVALYDQSAIDALSKQISELKTMLSIAEFQRKEMQAERDAAVADRDALSTMLAVAGGRLEEAANEIEDWGSYADEYFQKKHLLAEVVQSFRDDAKDAADAARAEGGA